MTSAETRIKELARAKNLDERDAARLLKAVRLQMRAPAEGILRNPFARFSGEVTSAAGVVVAAVGVLTSQFGMRFDGALDAHSSQSGSSFSRCRLASSAVSSVIPTAWTLIPAPVEDIPVPVNEECAAETVKLQAGLDKARDSKTNAVLAVKNPACGVRVLTSGPSRLDGTELHRIGSVTKTYVAAVILTLARDGALGLDDAISRWVPSVPGADEITVRQLLSRTRRLFNYTDDTGCQG